MFLTLESSLGTLCDKQILLSKETFFSAYSCKVQVLEQKASKMKLVLRTGNRSTLRHKVQYCNRVRLTEAGSGRFPPVALVVTDWLKHKFHIFANCEDTQKDGPDVKDSNLLGCDAVS